MDIRKRFRSAYVLDEAKLRRMLGVLDQSFSESGSDYNIRFETGHPQRKVTTVNSLEQLLLLDNSKKHPIKSLRITATTANHKAGDEEPPSHKCGIFFDEADIFASVDYRVSSSDTRWVNNCSALLVEQIERTLQGSWFAKLNANSLLRMTLLVMLPLLLVTAAISWIGKSPSRISTHMWLTDSNIAQISKSEEPVDPAEVLNMQIKNIQDSRLHSKLKWLKDWRVYAAISPLVLVFICLAYLAFQCYPPTVFNWGDMGDHYEGLVGRRKILWSAVIIGVFVGLLSNLAVYGLVDLTKN